MQQINGRDIVLAHEIGVDEPAVDLVRDVAQAYQPGSGDESRAHALALAEGALG